MTEGKGVSKTKLIFIILILIIIIFAAGNFYQWLSSQDEEELSYITEITTLLENQTRIIYAPIIIHDPPKDHSFQMFVSEGPKYFHFEWNINDIFPEDIRFVYDDSDQPINELNFTWAKSPGSSGFSSSHIDDGPIMGPSHGDGWIIEEYIINYETVLIQEYKDINDNDIRDIGDSLERDWIQINYTFSRGSSRLSTTQYLDHHPERDDVKGLKWLNITPTPEDLKFIKNGTSYSHTNSHRIYSTSNSPIIESWSSGYDHMLGEFDFEDIAVIKDDQPNSTFKIPIYDFPITEKYSVNISLTRKFKWDGQHVIVYVIDDDEETDWFSYSMYWDLRFGTIYLEVHDYELTNPEEIY